MYLKSKHNLIAGCGYKPHLLFSHEFTSAVGGFLRHGGGAVKLAGVPKTRARLGDGAYCPSEDVVSSFAVVI